MRVVLIKPPVSSYSRLISKVEVPAFPLDIAYLAAYLKANGIEVSTIDLVAEPFREETLRESLLRILPDVVGITTYTPSIFKAHSLARLAKQSIPEVKVIFGGHHASALPEELLKDKDVDYAVIGEGEATFLELLKSLEEKRDASSVKGIAFYENGKFIRTPQRPLIQDLDALPFPERQFLPLERYNVHITRYKGRGRSGSLMASRGCCFECSFCSKAVFGESYRYRSVDNVMEELFLMRQKYGISQVTFHDNLFTFKRDFTLRLCQRMSSEKLGINWTCQTRVNLIDEELLYFMKKAGCTQINFGIESGCEEILQGLSNKMISKDMVRQAVALCRKNKIGFECGFIFGHPDETIEMAKESIAFAKELKPNIASFFLLTPMPGTPYYRIAEERGVVDPAKYDRLISLPDKEPVFVISKMSPKELLEIQRRAYREYYFSFSYLLRRFSKLRSFMDIKNNLAGLFTILLLKKREAK